MIENKKIKEIFEWIVCILIALIIAVIIKTFVGFPTVISGASMDSTLKDKQRLWVSKIGIEINKYPSRFDIITFEAPKDAYVTKANANLNNPVAKYDNISNGMFSKLTSAFSIMQETSYIKRVIGLPGDHIEIKNQRVYVNGEAINEDYLDAGTVTIMERETVYSDVRVPDGYVYLLGDNREVSCDSRSFGCIPIEKIEGKAVFRFWPFNKIGSVQYK